MPKRIQADPKLRRRSVFQVSISFQAVQNGSRIRRPNRFDRQVPALDRAGVELNAPGSGYPYRQAEFASRFDARLIGRCLLLSSFHLACSRWSNCLDSRSAFSSLCLILSSSAGYSISLLRNAFSQTATRSIAQCHHGTVSKRPTAKRHHWRRFDGLNPSFNRHRVLIPRFSTFR